MDLTNSWSPVEQNDSEDTEPVARLSLAELAEAAGVSIRTVRYYIAEGLLPPPEGAGLRSAYTHDHRDRLRLIARLKAAYLPLREIRRRLAGLDAEAVRTLVHPRNAVPRPSPSPTALGEEADSAAAYLARLLPPRRERSPVASSPPVASPSARVGFRARPPEQISADDEAAADLTRADLERGAALAEEPPPLEAEPWRRVPLGPDAELLIREDAFQRQRDTVNWLVDWARKVLR